MEAKMVELYRDAEEIKETDIVFDCPNCGKSLAIDYRGAGLTIPCTDCGQYVDVPIPEGMEVTDIDSSDEEQEMQILNLRRSLGAAEEQIAQMAQRIEQIETTNRQLSSSEADSDQQFAYILGHVEIMRRHLQELTGELAKIADVARNGKSDN
jgi:transcription elongation factor Elf1